MRTISLFLLISIWIVASCVGRAEIVGNIGKHAQDAERPGRLHARLSPKFLPFLAQSTLFVLSREFRDLIRIPDIETRVDVPVIGEITLELKETQLNGMRVNAWDRAQLIPLPDDEDGTNRGRNNATLLLKADGISVDASSQWRWYKGVLHSHGKLSVSVIDCSVTARVHLWRRQDGRIGVDLSHVETTLGDLRITISESKWTWLYSLVKNLLGGPIKSVTEQQLREQLMTTVPRELNKLLAATPLWLTVWRDVAVGLGLEQLRATPETGLELDNSGLVVLNNGNGGDLDAHMHEWPMNTKRSFAQAIRSVRALCPYQPLPSNPVVDPGSPMMFWLDVDQVFMNCLLYMLNLDGFFKRRVPLGTGMEPGKPFISTLVQTLGRDVNLAQSYIDISLLKAPTVDLSSNGSVTLSMHDVSLKFIFFEGGQREEPLSFELKMQAQLMFELHVATVGSGSTFLFQSERTSHRVESRTRKTKQWKLKGLETSAVSMTNANGMSLLDVYPLAINLLSQQARHFVQKLSPMSFIESFVPVPVDLPWPLNKIRINDIDMDVLEKRWRVQADFVVDEEKPPTEDL